jgi:hypothetical protein
LVGVLLYAWIASGLIAALLGATELGYRLGRLHHDEDDETVAAQVSTWEGALLGLLGLLIGFTFAMAVTRFDGRRQLIAEEANAIHRVKLQADLLDQPLRADVQELVARYIDARVRFYEARANSSGVDAALRDTVALQSRLWNAVMTYARAHREQEVTSLLVEGVDRLIEAEGSREASVHNHVPLAVFLVLALVACMGVAATGYTCGLHGRRLRFGMVLMPLLIAMVAMLIFDLDHPRVGLIKAGQGPMLRVQQHQLHP